MVLLLVGNHPSAVSFSINKSDVVTSSVSQSLKDDTYKLFNIKRDIHVIPNFIELEKPTRSHCHHSNVAKKEKNYYSY
jgi:hypothetical protein